MRDLTTKVMKGAQRYILQNLCSNVKKSVEAARAVVRWQEAEEGSQEVVGTLAHLTLSYFAAVFCIGCFGAFR
jgi:hypothetical protein